MKHAKRVDGATPLKGNVFCDGSESRKTYALMPACAAWSLGRQVSRSRSTRKMSSRAQRRTFKATTKVPRYARDDTVRYFFSTLA